MKAHKVTLFIIDFDQLGADEVASTIENHRYPNDCLNVRVKSVETMDIGEWHDDHPLNKRETSDAAYQTLFPVKAV